VLIFVNPKLTLKKNYNKISAAADKIFALNVFSDKIFTANLRKFASCGGLIRKFRKQ
jgi:hypothetical protein